MGHAKDPELSRGESGEPVISPPGPIVLMIDRDSGTLSRGQVLPVGDDAEHAADDDLMVDDVGQTCVGDVIYAPQAPAHHALLVDDTPSDVLVKAAR
mmetsp:Transcript_25040/g.59148  ORF Transcript_25040/g.59148 Transcript_25040/m.59148 type:complete len:97 (-) Transcript_25040:129-419(-)